ncbi:MAG: hypothetical protein ACOC93_03455 [Planctomycetota bacterium]
MSYLIDGIRAMYIEPFDLGLQVRAEVDGNVSAVQCYLAGELADWQLVDGGAVAFVLPAPGPTEQIALLAVDASDVETNYAAEALPDDGFTGRIVLDIPRRMAHRPGECVRIYVGDAGTSVADELLLEAEIHPAGRGSGGFGFGFGGCGFGFDAEQAVGFGWSFGQGEFGFDCETLRWASEPMAPGTYPIRAATISPDGDETRGATQLVDVHGPPRPAADLAIADYDATTDTLQLTWTASEDLP